VFVVSGEIHIEMNDHAFHFFAQLLKNMLRKFLQLQDMVAAKLVSSIAENIVLYELLLFDACYPYFVAVC
jgi:hypothetical protein